MTWTSKNLGPSNTLWTLDTPYLHAEISEHGGHLVSCYSKARQREILFVSPKADLTGNTAIRAGVPICWPWFSDRQPPAQRLPNLTQPSHGFARTSRWQVSHKETDDNDASLELTLPSEIIAKHLRSDITLKVRYTFQENQISISLITSNKSAETFIFTQALHTYFAVTQIKETRISGLAHDYLDKTRGFDRFEGEDEVLFDQEVDRVYLTSAEKTQLHDAKSDREIYHHGHDSIVIWNPWKENSEKLADLEDDSYKHFVCIETANTGKKYTLLPGRSCDLKQTIVF